MVIRALFLALALVGNVSAASVTLSAGYTATVADFSCQTVVAAFLSTYGASSGDCGYQAAGPGTPIVFRNASGTALGTPTVSSVSGWVPPPTNSSLQTQVNTLQTNVSTLSGRVTTVENAVGVIQNSGSANLISNADDAKAIVGAFLLLFAVAGSYKAIKSTLGTADYLSDEKH